MTKKLDDALRQISVLPETQQDALGERLLKVLSGPPQTHTPEDITKLHNESHQLRNQQFLLTHIGVLAAGLSSWFIPELAKGSTDYRPQTVATIVLLVLLAVLYRWSIGLRKQICRISIYLRLREYSDWEEFFHEGFSGKIGVYLSPTVWVCVGYVMLAIVVLANYFNVIGLEELPVPALTFTRTLGAPLVGEIFVIYLLVVIPPALFRRWTDKRIEKAWRELFKSKGIPVKQTSVSAGPNKEETSLSGGVSPTPAS